MIYKKDGNGRECRYECDENEHYIYDRYLLNSDLEEIFYRIHLSQKRCRKKENRMEKN